ncbi:AraC family transcriptional regulator [Cellulomonas sp. H30R-01]|uniref:AraC family transcriptional regulator n=1 Tax=Cellulomonas sp. H30R-01 TaxID=2704467 RepID=UPI00138DCE9A|nr:AraC family transcriptional regulator [Cellulomonas sp. H30R-01]QHT54692.1 AraC family transcriptional regulator [Cellulomonas sp. H30R-01]
MRRSSAATPLPFARARRRADGAPVVAYDRRPGRVPIGAELFSGDQVSPQALPGGVPHAHDFFVLVHVARGSGTLLVDGRPVPLVPGDTCLVPPGQLVGGATTDDPADARSWVVFFTADAVAGATASPLAWRFHPLLAPFAETAGGGPRTLRVPDEDRSTWDALLRVLAREAPAHDDPPALAATDEAATAALTLLLVSLARLVGPPADGGADPLVAAVLDAVEAGFRDPISTRDVARALGYTTGHLTTVVRERTGRTVLEWLTERRMIEARRLLVETDLPVAVVAERTGHRDAAYLVRRFREQHGVTPARWRRGAR